MHAIRIFELLLWWWLIGVVCRICIGFMVPNFITPDFSTMLLSIILWPLTCWAATIGALSLPFGVIYVLIAWMVLR